MSESEFLGVDEIAELLHVHPATVTAAARAGELPGRKVGREWRFSRDAVRSWFAGTDAAEPLAARIAPAVARQVVGELATALSEVGKRLAVAVKYREEDAL